VARISRLRSELLRIALPAVTVAVLAYSAFFSILSIQRHEAHLTHTADLGQIDLAIWNTSRGRFVQEIKGEELSTRLTDHLEPVFFLVGQLFYIWDDVRVLLAAQATILALAALPVFAYVTFGLKLPGTRTRIPVIAGAWAALAYLLAPQAQAATVADFHASPLAAFPLALLLLLGARHRSAPAIVVAFLCLSVKEEVSLLVLAACLYLALVHKWRPGWFVALIAAGWFVIATFIIIPRYSQAYYGVARSPYLARYTQVAIDQATDSSGLITQVANRFRALMSANRAAYVLGLLVSFAGMPLLAPEVSLVASPLIAANVLSNYPAMYSGEFHYSAPVMSVLACAAGVGATRWLKLFSRCSPWLRWLAMAPLVVAPIAYQTAQGFTPIGAEYPFVRRTVTSHHRLLSRFATQVPSSASLSVTPSLHPHFSHRERIYTFPDLGDCEYALLDVTSTTDMHPNDFHHAFLALLGSGYGIVDSADGYILMRKGHGSAHLSDEFFSFARSVPSPENPLDVWFGASLRLLGYDIVDDAKWRETSLRLYWQPMGQLDNSLVPHLVFVDGWGRRITDSTTMPFLELIWYPLSQWTPGEVVTTTTTAANLGQTFETYVYVTAAGDPADIAARLPVQVRKAPRYVEAVSSLNCLRLPLMVRAATRFQQSFAPLAQQPPTRHSTGLAEFGSRLTLHAADIKAGSTRFDIPIDNELPAGGQSSTVFRAVVELPTPADTLELTFLWTTHNPVEQRLAVSVRLVDNRGQVVEQQDGPFHGGYLPPREWRPDEIVGDFKSLPLGALQPETEYTVRLIVYNLDTLAPLLLENGHSHLDLARVKVCGATH